MYSVVSHDAGGAQLLSSWCKQNKINANYSLSGPAIKIFYSKLGKIKNLSYKKSIDLSKILICGTGTASNIQVKAIDYAKKKNKKTIAWLEHWINYKERFYYKKKYFTPDEIWVSDSYAKNEALKFFSNTKVKCKKNPFLFELKKKIKVKRNKENKNIIYLSGLFYNFNKNNKFDKKIINLEKKSLLNFVTNIKNFNMKINDIRIRYHPSEKYFFYRENLKKNKITVSKNIQLIDDLNWADLIIGANSMAIYLCKMLNLRVYSSLPYNFSGSIIPLKKMRNISLLSKNSNGN
jgi:hypothetical protein